jgi:mono/diheme cytochrome c family protein
MKISPLLAALLLGAASTCLQAAGVNKVQDHYRDQGAGPFSFDRGEMLWNSQPYQGRQCAACHGPDLTQAGRHQRTKKPIEPMAASVNGKRYTDLKEVEKWFTRNCKWTWGRECTAQEKGDLLEYLKQL